MILRGTIGKNFLQQFSLSPIKRNFEVGPSDEQALPSINSENIWIRYRFFDV